MQPGLFDNKPNETTLSVSALTKSIKSALEGKFKTVKVKGEISNFRPAASGHIYFSLKDADAAISAALFKGVAAKINSRLIKDGTEVICHGRISVYAPRGSYQLIIEKIEAVGTGNLQAAFEELKNKLNQEGLFATKHKKQLPSMPKKIAVVTSPTGAAIRDVLSVLQRRHAGVSVLVVPTKVQGEGADTEIIQAIEKVDRYQLADVILLTRGGGSIEDLWCFNSEVLARVLYKCQIPIVSAVGHEIDFTIADFVADVRAPTPSAAAEILVAEKEVLQEKVESLIERLNRSVFLQIETYRLRLNSIVSQLKNPKDRIFDLRMRFDDWSDRMAISLKTSLQKKRSILSETKRHLKPALQQLVNKRNHQLNTVVVALKAMSPLSVLNRGYSLVYANKELVKSKESLSAGDELLIRVSDGSFTSVVTEGSSD